MGVSTRKIKDITEVLCSASFSKSLVSSPAGSLESELKAWRMRRLEMKAYPYLFVNVRYEKARVGGRVVRIFPNRGACLRLVTALAIGLSEEWLSGRRFLDMREFEEQRRQEEQKTEEVALMERLRKDKARRKLHKPQDLTDKDEGDEKIAFAYFQEFSLLVAILQVCWLLLGSLKILSDKVLQSPD